MGCQWIYIGQFDILELFQELTVKFVALLIEESKVTQLVLDVFELPRHCRV